MAVTSPATAYQFLFLPGAKAPVWNSTLQTKPERVPMGRAELASDEVYQDQLDQEGVEG